MIFLKNFTLIKADDEFDVLLFQEKRKIYNNTYPFGIFQAKEFDKIDFENITIFYGGNGSGKSTLLNIIANKIKAKRKNEINKGRYFDMYVDNCDYKMSKLKPEEIKIITSDDIFEYLLDIEFINSNVNRKKDELVQEYLDRKYTSSTEFYNNFDELKLKVQANSKTMSRYVRDRLGTNNIISQSNGETALLFWEREITENAIYILDEPENSLSAQNQLKLKKFIEESVRFYNCQFIISTHSPFLLNLHDANIYNLDSVPVTINKWNQLENVKVYYDFFKEKESEFENG